jgi:hypothetical protein
MFGDKAGATGLEPATSAVTGQRSNQLSYAPALRAENQRETRARPSMTPAALAAVWPRGQSLG